MTLTTRFAPSPTGLLHLGHAFSALLAFQLAQKQGGRFLLRIEDVDTTRSKPHWEQQIYDDLTWLGLSWETPVMRQSDRTAAYDAAIHSLAERGLVYPCSCSRADIKSALSAPQEGNVHHGPDGVIYPGTCRGRRLQEAQHTDALRLNMEEAIKHLPTSLRFREHGENPAQHDIECAALPADVGDIVLRRRISGEIAYHLAVVVDDAAQKVTYVTRGSDLFDATKIHVTLATLLGLPIPHYHHHRLVRDENGKRLAKRDDARSLKSLREQGNLPQDIFDMLKI